MGSIDLSKLKPDEYKVVSVPKSTSIDLSTLKPDDYKVISSPEPSRNGLISLRGLAEGATEALPGIGAVIGGGLGTLVEPGFGTVAGIAGGGALGGNLKNIINTKFLKKEENTYGNLGKDIALGGLEGLTQEAGGKIIGKVAEAATPLVKTGIEKSKNVASEVGKTIKNIGLKTAEALTGVPNKEIETYAFQYDKVKDLLDKAGSGGIPHAAEIVKENLQNSIKITKDTLNNQIEASLSNANKDKNINISSIIDSLEKYKERINPNLNPEHIDDINKIIERVKAAAPGGNASIQEVQQIKKFLQNAGASAFGSSPLQFQVGSEGANASSRASAQAKELMDKFGPEEIKNANRQLFQLHRIEDRINKNLIIPGKSDAALMAVGSGAQNKESLALQRLGQITGKDFINEANVLSAANRFNNPTLSPAYGTGKALIPATIGGAIGGAVGGHTGMAIGASAGGILASPAGLKTAINAGRISSRAVAGVANKFGINANNINQLYQILQNPEAQQLLIKMTANPVARRLLSSQFNQNNNGGQ